MQIDLVIDYSTYSKCHKTYYLINCNLFSLSLSVLWCDIYCYDVLEVFSFVKFVLLKKQYPLSFPLYLSLS